MSDVMVREETGISVEVTDYKQAAINWLKNTGSKCSDTQLNQFVDVCCAFKLNPIKREVYAVPYGSQMNVIVGYETYIKRAERSGRLAGWKAWTEGSGADMVAKIEIKRADWAQPFYHEVYFEEYNQNSAIWKSKPRTMLKKVVIAQGFRLCFSEELGGMPYTKDELPDEHEEPKVINITPIAQEAADVIPETPMSNMLIDMRNNFFAVLKQAGAIPTIDAAIESGNAEQISEVYKRTKDFLTNNKYL